MHSKKQDTKPVGRGIRERRRKVENDDRPTVCGVDAVLYFIPKTWMMVCLLHSKGAIEMHYVPLQTSLKSLIAK
jgi:hypothetical protein